MQREHIHSQRWTFFEPGQSLAVAPTLHLVKVILRADKVILLHEEVIQKQR